MPLHEDTVREELKKVIDPELFINIVDLGLIYVVDVIPHKAEKSGEAAEGESAKGDEATVAKADADSEGESTAEGDEKYDVKIEMTMTSPMCPAGPQLVAQSKDAAASIDSVVDVEVKVVMDPPWTQDMMTDDARDQLGIF